MKLKNISAGPRGLYVGGSLTMVDPGATVDGVADQEAIDVAAWFAPADGMIDAPDSDNLVLDNLTDDELRDLIEQRTGKRPHHRAGRVKLIEALA